VRVPSASLGHGAIGAGVTDIWTGGGFYFFVRRGRDALVVGFFGGTAIHAVVTTITSTTMAVRMRIKLECFAIGVAEVTIP